MVSNFTNTDSPLSKSSTRNQPALSDELFSTYKDALGAALADFENSPVEGFLGCNLGQGGGEPIIYGKLFRCRLSGDQADIIISPQLPEIRGLL